MNLIRAVSNITCDLIKSNKGIKPDEVVAFVGKISDKMGRIETFSKNKIDFDIPEFPKSKKLRISMVEEENN